MQRKFSNLHSNSGWFHSQRTKWGDASLVEAERRLLANALLDLGNERFALFSEACIPVYDFPTVYAFLTGANTSFVDCYENGGSRSRYRPFFATRNITLARWRKGAQWFEMDRALALEVVADEPYIRMFRGFCAGRWRCLTDEHYLPTLLSLLGWARNANRTLTYADWKRPQGMHPHTHEAAEVTEELVRRIREDAGDRCFPAFRDFCVGRSECLIDEHYLPTLVSLLGWGPRNANRTLTYADWKRAVNRHPHTHGGGEVTEALIREIREDGGGRCFYNGARNGICNLFARKFSPDALEPLLRVAPKVMGFG